ncbi:MFS transporter, partial [Salmonella enterica subsp. enterica serovar Corvallis]|nr:MFS transporter [Salmonella enterica subsp. enterica serovar Corvallis]
MSMALTAPPTRKRFLIVACLFIGIFIAYLDRVNVSVLAANEPFLAYMGIEGMPLQIGMMMTVFLAAYGIANVVLSPLGDYLGPRKAMMLCILIWTIALMIGGVATSFALIIICRILLGIGEGFYYPLQSVFIKNWFPKQERGRANAAWIVGQSVAPAIAMPFFTWWIGTHGWRSNFFLC